MDALKKKMSGGDKKDEKKDDKKDAQKEDKSGNDDTDELGLRTKTGERLYRVYKIGEAKAPGQAAQSEPVDIVIGVANSKYTEVVKGPLKAGDKVVVRSLLADPTKQ
jgi:hypothetical protein